MKMPTVDLSVWVAPLRILSLVAAIVVLFACKKEKSAQSDSVWQGSGVEVFSDYEPQADKLVRLFYYVPQNVQANTPIVLVFHGAERDAMSYRNAIVAKAIEHQFIVVVPEFSELNFPTESAYQLGNVYVDGDQPSPTTLRAESLWSFSLVEPIFSFVKNKTKNNSAQYHLIGHSAGAQFAHRFLMFKPSARFEKAIVSAAGWYTATDNLVAFPYGMQASPLENLNLTALFAKKVIVQVGSADNNPNASTLRRTPQADAQGLHRLARAQYYYTKAQQAATNLNVPFSWQLSIIPGLTHDYVAALGYSADLLFP